MELGDIGLYEVNLPALPIKDTYLVGSIFEMTVVRLVMLDITCRHLVTGSIYAGEGHKRSAC